jgi:hypothetical protein
MNGSASCPPQWRDMPILRLLLRGIEVRLPFARKISASTSLTSPFFVTPSAAAPIVYTTPMTRRCAKSANSRRLPETNAEWSPDVIVAAASVNAAAASMGPLRRSRSSNR